MAQTGAVLDLGAGTLSAWTLSRIGSHLVVPAGASLLLDYERVAIGSEVPIFEEVRPRQALDLSTVRGRSFLVNLDRTILIGDQPAHAYARLNMIEWTPRRWNPLIYREPAWFHPLCQEAREAMPNQAGRLRTIGRASLVPGNRMIQGAVIAATAVLVFVVADLARIVIEMT